MGPAVKLNIELFINGRVSHPVSSRPLFSYRTALDAKKPILKYNPLQRNYHSTAWSCSDCFCSAVGFFWGFAFRDRKIQEKWCKPNLKRHQPKHLRFWPLMASGEWTNRCRFLQHEWVSASQKTFGRNNMWFSSMWFNLNSFCVIYNETNTMSWQNYFTNSVRTVTDRNHQVKHKSFNI